MFRHAKCWSLPKNKQPTKWRKVYHGDRGKYSLQPVTIKAEGQKSSTYPMEKNSSLREVYQTYITNTVMQSKAGEVSGSPTGSSTTLNELDEFAKMRCRTNSVASSYAKNKAGDSSDFDIDDDEATLLDLPNLSARPSKLSSISQTEAVEKVCDSISHLSLQFTNAAKIWKEYFKSPVLSSRRSQQASLSEFNLSDSKMRGSENDRASRNTGWLTFTAMSDETR